MVNKKILALTIFFAALSVIVYWSYGHAFVSVTVDNHSGEKLTYTFSNQSSDAVIQETTDEKTLKKLLPTGNYEVSVTTDSQSFMTVAQSGSFLSTTAITGKLQNENYREFVGNNPSPCAQYLGDRLFSYECGSELTAINQHAPATSTQPTYVSNAGFNSESTIEGVVYTNSGPVILTGPVFVSEEVLTADFQIGLLGENFSISNIQNVTQLPFNKKYSVKPYKVGFIIYSDDFSEVYYYSSVSSLPEKLNLVIPKDLALNPVSLETKGDNLILIYSDGSGEDDPEENKDAKTQIVIQGPTKNTYLNIDGFINDVALCGEKLCVLAEGKLNVYSIKESDLILDFTIKNALSIEQFKNKTYVVTESGVLLIDPVNKSSVYSVSFGDSSFCGIQESSAGYLLCLVDKQNNIAALSVDIEKTDASLINKKMNILANHPGISFASAYKNIIFVTPDVNGKLKPDEVTIGGLSEGQIKKSESDLTEALARANISRDEFIVVNTANPNF